MGEYAGFLTRAFAWVVDQVIVFMFTLLAALLMSVFLGILASFGHEWAKSIVAAMILILLLLWVSGQFIYFGYFWSTRGYTLGMMLFGIQVLGPNSELISFTRAGLRGTFGYSISCLIIGLGYLWALFDKHNQTWHDMIFGTNVFRRIGN
jgi:uncharacterized RDD family membrane protein YckC